jgi:hypothetical protein
VIVLLPHHPGHPAVMVNVRIPVVTLARLTPAPLSLVDGGPVGGHVRLLSRGRWTNHTVLASVDAPTIEITRTVRAGRLRAVRAVLAGAGCLLVGFVGGSLLGPAGHPVAAIAVLALGLLGEVPFLVLATRNRRHATRLERTVPIAARPDRDGAIVVGPVHPDAARAWATANPPGMMTILEEPPAPD